MAFLQEGRYITPLWLINRFVDLCFTIDIVLTFNLAYQAPSGQGGHWVFNKSKIIHNCTPLSPRTFQGTESHGRAFP